jgi:hypothetical protein
MTGLRTTLNLDPRVLAAARERVATGLSHSVGQAVSELALTTLMTAHPAPMAEQVVLLPTSPGHVMTDQMVAQALADDDA